MLNELTFLQVGYFIWDENLFALDSIETVPEANDVVHRSSDTLILLVNVQGKHISRMRTLTSLKLKEIPALGNCRARYEGHSSLAARGSYPELSLREEKLCLLNLIAHVKSLDIAVIIYESSSIQIIDLYLSSFQSNNQELKLRITPNHGGILLLDG